MSIQCDTGPLKKNIPAAMIAATSMSAVNPCGNAAALEVTDDRTECERGGTVVRPHLRTDR